MGMLVQKGGQLWRSLLLFCSWNQGVCYSVSRKHRLLYSCASSSLSTKSNAYPPISPTNNAPACITGRSLSGLPDLHKPFVVLGIETSCDDTGVAIVRSDGKILSNVLMSQVISCAQIDATSISLNFDD